MNNVKKFDLTKAGIANLKVQLKEEEDRLFNSKRESKKEYVSVVYKIASLDQLYIDARKATIAYEGYVQPIWVKKRRINVVPCCFIIQLYKEELRREHFTEEELANIPFELRGFWEMENALKFINEFNEKKLLWTRNVQRIMNYKRDNKDDVDMALSNLTEAIEAVEILPPKKGCIEVNMNDKKFSIKTRNMKLNIVPLCKMIASQYVNVISKIQDCNDVGEEDNDVKRVTKNIMRDFDVMINKYFMLPLVKN